MENEQPHCTMRPKQKIIIFAILGVVGTLLFYATSPSVSQNNEWVKIKLDDLEPPHKESYERKVDRISNMIIAQANDSLQDLLLKQTELKNIDFRDDFHDDLQDRGDLQYDLQEFSHNILIQPEEYHAVGYFDLAQYEIAKRKLGLNNDSIQYVNMRSHKMNTNSSHHPQDLSFKIQKYNPENLPLHDPQLNLAYKYFLVQVTDGNSDGKQVPGCSFQTKQYFSDWRKLELCRTVGFHDDEGYTVQCTDYAAQASKACGSVEIRYRFGFYEQYQDEPRILPADYLIYNASWCAGGDIQNIPNDDTDRQQQQSPPKSAESPSNSAQSPLKSLNTRQPITWTVDQHKTCDTLQIHSQPVTQYTAEQACDCTNKFDDVYLIGTSHIRFWADFLQKKCHGQNFEGILHNHKDLSQGNIHYLAWVFIEQLHFEIQMNLPQWLNPDLYNLTSTTKPGETRSIAIWIVIGSWDFSKISYNFTMEHALVQYKEILQYILSRISGTKTKVDFRVISTTPMTDKWYRNNFAIGAYNAKQQTMVQRLAIDFTDMFSMELPCKDFIEGNHYFYRLNETFGGNIGANIYLGHFLPKVCDNIK